MQANLYSLSRPHALAWVGFLSAGILMWVMLVASAVAQPASAMMSSADTANLLVSSGGEHAYALPETLEEVGGFVGPIQLDRDKACISRKMAQFSLIDSGRSLEPESMGAVTAEKIVAALSQRYIVEGLRVELKLDFVDQRTSRVQVKIVNGSPTPRRFHVQCEGEVVGRTIRIDGARVSYDLESPGRKLILELTSSRRFSVLAEGAKGDYIMRTVEPLGLAPGEAFECVLLQTYHAGDRL